MPYAYAGASIARFLVHLLAALKKSNRALTAAFIEALIEANSYTQVLLMLDFFIFFWRPQALIEANSFLRSSWRVAVVVMSDELQEWSVSYDARTSSCSLV